MHRRSAVLVLLLLLSGCTTAKLSRASAAHVVVPAQQLATAVSLPGWSPTDAQIAACEQALSRALAREKRNLSDYYLRLAGVMRDGKRHIAGIAAYKSIGTHYLRPPSDPASEHGEEVLVLPTFGGGSAFFRFEYDAERGRLVELDFNAAL